MKIPVDSLVNHTVLSAPVNHQKDATVHFNFHLSGDESPEQSRRIANAVLALGGLLGAQTSIAQTPVIPIGELSSELRRALKDGASANVSVGHRVTEGQTPTSAVGERVGGVTPKTESRTVEVEVTDAVEKAARDEYLKGIMDRSETQFGAQEDGSVTEKGAPPVPATPPDLDANGLPWDERIHSSSRAINADGTWRYRKNVPEETKREVEAELRGLIDGLVKAVKDILPPNADFSHGGVVTVPPPVPLSGPEYVLASVGLVSESALKDPNTVVSPPTPPAPPVPTGALQRTYSDVVNLIMSRKVQPDTYVAILGMSLPEFAKHVISAPNDATLMFDALDAASAT